MKIEPECYEVERMTTSAGTRSLACSSKISPTLILSDARMIMLLPFITLHYDYLT